MDHLVKMLIDASQQFKSTTIPLFYAETTDFLLPWRVIMAQYEIAEAGGLDPQVVTDAWTSWLTCLKILTPHGIDATWNVREHFRFLCEFLKAFLIGSLQPDVHFRSAIVAHGPPGWQNCQPMPHAILYEKLGENYIPLAERPYARVLLKSTFARLANLQQQSQNVAGIFFGMLKEAGDYIENLGDFVTAGDIQHYAEEQIHYLDFLRAHPALKTMDDSFPLFPYSLFQWSQDLDHEDIQAIFLAMLPDSQILQDEDDDSEDGNEDEDDDLEVEDLG